MCRFLRVNHSSIKQNKRNETKRTRAHKEWWIPSSENKTKHYILNFILTPILPFDILFPFSSFFSPTTPIRATHLPYTAAPRCCELLIHISSLAPLSLHACLVVSASRLLGISRGSCDSGSS